MAQMIRERVIGQPLSRLDGPKKVTGTAPYAFEHSFKEIAYGFPVQSRIAKGQIASIDVSKAQAIEGVITILTYENAPRLSAKIPANIRVLQSNTVDYRGQFVAFVVAHTLEVARQAAEAVVVSYSQQPHDVQFDADRKDVYTPKTINAPAQVDTSTGDVEAAFASSAVSIDTVYTTPAYHPNPMEPHATVASWRDDGVTLYDSNQGAHAIQTTVAQAFGLKAELVRVLAPYVGGGFGSKYLAVSSTILAVMASKVVKRPVKFSLTRQHMFAETVHRAPSFQHLRLAADKEGHLTAISHDIVSPTSKLVEFVEQTGMATRTMYAAPNRSNTHKVLKLDVPVSGTMRAPGESLGMFALESAMDELAIACKIDPIELRIRNEPATDPATGLPFSSRGLVACLREGAQRFDWQARDPHPGMRRIGRWRIGLGVAASTYPVFRLPSTAIIHLNQQGQYHVRIDAVDIGTGAWTVLTQIAADALEVPIESIHLEIGDSLLPMGASAGGSAGTASWGTAIVEAAHTLRERLQHRHGVLPEEGIEATGQGGENPDMKKFAMHAFGAQFAEVRVNIDTGEVRVPRLLGVFAAGRIMNAKTARSQFLGGMTMGLSMALYEHSVMDPHFGDFVNHDLAEYHIASNADVKSIEATWIDENDPYVNPMGAKGIGEIGVVGTAAAIANATYHATGIRIRDLPITLDKLLL